MKITWSIRTQLTLYALVALAPVALLGLVDLQRGATLRAAGVFAAVASAALLALWLGARISAPIRRLSSLAGRIAAGDLNERIDPSGPAEIARFAHDFNSMLDARDRAGAALRDSEAHLAAVIATAMDAIVKVDDTGRVASFNAAAERMFGRSAAQACGMHIGGLIPARFIGAFQRYHAVLGSIGIGKPSLAGVWPILAKRSDGSKLAVEVSVSSVSASSGRFHTLILRDTAHRQRAAAAQREIDQRLRRINEELEQRVAQRTRDLQAANEELEAFSYSIAHDLRSPLRSISRFATLLNEQHAAGLQPAGLRCLASVIAGSGKMERLIASLLEFARIGRGDMAREVVDTGAVVRAALDELLPLHARKVEVLLGDMPQVNGDAALLGQVFNNLIANALKFSANKPFPVIRIDGRILDNEITFQVTDNGDGFDMNYAGKLFGVFQRLHSDREFEGTGIGLAIVHRIVTRHGGRVWAHAREGEGAKFQFSIPHSAAGSAVAGAPAEDLTMRMNRNG